MCMVAWVRPQVDEGLGLDAGHGREDTFIGIHHSQKLHDKYGGEKQLITFPGDHNSMRQDHFYRRVQRFFKAVLIDSPAGRPCKAFAHVEIADPRQAVLIQPDPGRSVIWS